MGGIIGLVTRNKVSNVRESIYYHKDRVFIPLSFWQAKDKIHAYINPREGKNLLWVYNPCGSE